MRGMKGMKEKKNVLFFAKTSTKTGKHQTIRGKSDSRGDGIFVPRKMATGAGNRAIRKRLQWLGPGRICRTKNSRSNDGG